MTHLLLAVIYLAFISLGLPDSILGAAWPVMYGQLGVPLSYAGVIAMIISLGTVVSSLMSDRLTRRFGSGLVTAVSVTMTAAALFGFSVSRSFAMLCLIAVPYGLGAGGVDACLNNYVALHYASRHMSWLHCMWGIGASAGPVIMGRAITGGFGWPMGYRVIFWLQVVLTAILFLSLPLWQKRPDAGEESGAQALRFGEILRIPGVREVLICFFCYCAIEQTTGLWAASYLVLANGVSEELAASLAALFFAGITGGRALNGFLTFRYDDKTLIRVGCGVILLGVLLIPLGGAFSMAGFVLTGLGCAPVYPCVIHSTPAHFGAERSQAIIGVQMAAAYVGTCVMPPVFGLIARRISVRLLAPYLLLLLLLMALMHERLLKKTA